MTTDCHRAHQSVSRMSRGSNIFREGDSYYHTSRAACARPQARPMRATCHHCGLSALNNAAYQRDHPLSHPLTLSFLTPLLVRLIATVTKAALHCVLARLLNYLRGTKRSQHCVRGSRSGAAH
eukprot:6190029-Pleurochrysis_carterae.AAC.4